MIKDVSDLLVEWEEQRKKGAEPTAQELCEHHPELAEELHRRICELKETDWLFDLDDQEATSPEPPGTGACLAGDTQLPASSRTVAEFTECVVENGLMTQLEIQEFSDRPYREGGPETARQLATRLVGAKRLTFYQASTVLSCGNGPLELGNYVVLEILNSGGMGVVYKALHRRMNRVVALKILPPTVTDSPHKVQRFKREVEAIAKLSHPNIVIAHDAAESHGVHFLVMEYVEGQNLFDAVSEHGTMPVQQARDLILQAAHGLQYIHAKGIVHRDVKPANLLLASDGTVKLADLGLARFQPVSELGSVNINQSLTREGALMGTAAYMSPEQALDTRCADQRSDLYSLGCTFYFLLMGRPPHEGDTIMKTLVAHREQSPPPVRHARPDVSREVEAIMMRMMRRSPADRFQSMAEVIDALQGGEFSATATQHRLNGARVAIWTVAAVVIFSMLCWMYFSGVVVKLTTPGGVVEVHVNQPDTLVQVLDQNNAIEVSQLGDADKISIKVDEGQHRLRVIKEGFEFFTQDFAIEKGGTTVVHAKLVPITAKADARPVALHEYQLDTGDVLGIYIQGVLGLNGLPQPMIPKDPSLPPAVGYPVPVLGDGNIHLPLVAPIRVKGRTLRQALHLIRNAYTIDNAFIPLGKERMIVTLMRRRTAEVQAALKSTINPGDTLAVYVEGVLGSHDEPPTVIVPEDLALMPAIGYPFVVQSDGILELPLAGSIDVGGMTVTQALGRVKTAYTVDRKLLPLGKERVMLTLIRKHNGEHAEDAQR